MRCPYCGNENPPDHRFCGMCGRPLLETRADDSGTEPPPHSDPEPPAPAPAYTGGLFNLNAPADKPYRSLDYLLEDDEEPKSNKGLMFLCLIALVLAGGLGWLRWRNVNLPEWFKTHVSASKTTTPPAPNSPDASANSSPTDQPNPSPSIQPIQPTVPAPSPSTSNPATPTSPVPEASSTTSPAPSPATSANPPNAAPPPADSNSGAAAPPPDSTPPANDSSTPAPAAASDKHDATPAASAPPAKPKPAPKPTPKPAPKAPDQVTLGEQYLYGRGVPQNCEKGLRYVKPAADQSNPKAMITMGALYATGHCLSRDLPTAYRFFALALRGDPDNGPLRQNAEMVWKQMTAEERKQAIRMTQ